MVPPSPASSAPQPKAPHASCWKSIDGIEALSRLVLQGPADDLLRNEGVRKAYLGI